MPVTVERVDFVSVLTLDVERARAFYAGTLGLPLERDGNALMLHRRYAPV